MTWTSTCWSCALLGRLLAVRVSLIAGWTLGIAWLQGVFAITRPLLPMAVCWRGQGRLP